MNISSIKLLLVAMSVISVNVVSFDLSKLVPQIVVQLGTDASAAPPAAPKAPTNTTPKATHGNGCEVGKFPLRALAPIDKDVEGNSSIWGLTSVEQPILWFYVPYKLTNEQPVEISLEDSQGKPLLGKQVIPAIGEKVGVIGLRLPKLPKVKTNYLWTFTVRCDKEDPSKNESVQGWIQQTSLDSSVTEQLKKLSSIEQSEIYRKNKVMFDALTSLAQLRMNKPTDAAGIEAWKSLLTNWIFEEMPEEPVVDLPGEPVIEVIQIEQPPSSNTRSTDRVPPRPRLLNPPITP
jgi:Domain of Unknown Function (DUF928)